MLRRAFGVLGPTEAAAAMGAFLVTFVVLGWRPGDPFPGGTSLAMASGAAFAAVVVGQGANAFACRSTTRTVVRMRRPGRLFAAAIALQLALLGLLLGVPPLADLLGQAVPPAPAWVAIALAAAAVLAADSAHKLVRRRRTSPRRHRDPGGG